MKEMIDVTAASQASFSDNNLLPPHWGSKLHDKCKQASDPLWDRKLF